MFRGVKSGPELVQSLTTAKRDLPFLADVRTSRFIVRRWPLRLRRGRRLFFIPREHQRKATVVGGGGEGVRERNSAKSNVLVRSLRNDCATRTWDLTERGEAESNSEIGHA